MNNDLFTLRTDQSTRIIELKLPEELDDVEFDRLNESVLRLLQEQTEGRWVLDLTHVAYAGSSVLGLMVNMRQQIRGARGKLVLCGLSDRLIQIFHACSLERLFVISRTRVEALQRVLW